MQLDIFDMAGKSTGKVTLEESIFGVEPNHALLAQYVRVFMANKRQGTSKAKTRGEVSGGGKKPWKQKGTGRARHGSIRSPLWVKGGVAHGPKPRNHSLTLPKKMRKAALISALSAKALENGIRVVEKIDAKKISKTKDISSILSSLKLKGKTLFVLLEKNEAVLRNGRNVKGLEVALSGNLSTFEVMGAKNILFAQDALENIQSKYKGN